jgi:predicted nucleic-acid-binding protein
MIAVDTNIIVRFLTRDEPKQSALAAKCISGGVFVSDGVLVETEWVLRDAFGWQRARINYALASFIAIEQVTVAQHDHLQWALERHREGADWADALHLIAARGQTAYATFDRKLAKQAGPDSPVAVQLLA